MDPDVATCRRKLSELLAELKSIPLSKDTVEQRRKIRARLAAVYDLLNDLGFGEIESKINTVWERRDSWSIWHIHHQVVQIPGSLTVQQALELMSNGHCGD